jgi:hypothetical protein
MAVTMNADKDHATGRAVIISMAVAGCISGITTSFGSVLAFKLVAYLGAPLLLLLALGITYALLRRLGWVRLKIGAWRVGLVSLAVIVAYPVVGAIFDLASAAFDRWMGGNWGSIGAFLALLCTGLFSAVLAWMATTSLTTRPDKPILLLFVSSAFVSAVASSLASAVAARNMDAGFRVVLLLFPGVLFTVGMTLFGGVFGNAVARACRQAVSNDTASDTAGVGS